MSHSAQFAAANCRFAKRARVCLVAGAVESKSTEAMSKQRRALFLRWIALWPLTLGLMLYPVSNGILRAATVVAITILWLGAIWLFRRLKSLCMVLIGLLALAVVFVLLPDQKVSPASLGREYVNSLRSYENTRYVWGGENRLGIDCSGLVRAALINAAGKESVQTFNPSLMRFAADLWWHDCSARALGEEHRQQTIRLFETPGINGIELGKLQPGDLAVTDDGVHVLAFLGGNEWIEADPDVKRVLIVTVPSTNAWFDTPVKVMRWRMLEESRPAARTE